MANTQSKTDLLEQISKLVAENTELKKEKAEFLAKEAGFMARIMELEQNAEKSRLRDTELNARIIELERLAKENEKRFATLEQNQNDAVDKLENGDNFPFSNVSDPVINHCIDTNFKSLEGDIENISDIISDDTEHRASGSSDICQEKDNRSSTFSETNSNDTFEDKESEFFSRSRTDTKEFFT